MLDHFNSDLTASSAARFATDDSYDVFVKNLTLWARVGIHPHERDRPQPVVIDLTLSVRRGGAGLGVVDYEDVATRVARVVERGHIDLLETLADAIADECLRDDRVLTVTVHIAKPTALPGGANVGIEFRVARHG